MNKANAIMPRSYTHAITLFGALNPNGASVKVWLENTFPNQVDFIRVQGKEGQALIKQWDLDNLETNHLKFIKVARLCGFKPNLRNLMTFKFILLYLNSKNRRYYQLNQSNKTAA